MSAAFCFCRENKYGKLQEENKHGHSSFRNYMKAEIYVLRKISFVHYETLPRSIQVILRLYRTFVQKEESGDMLHLESSFKLFYVQ